MRSVSIPTLSTQPHGISQHSAAQRRTGLGRTRLQESLGFEADPLVEGHPANGKHHREKDGTDTGF